MSEVITVADLVEEVRTLSDERDPLNPTDTAICSMLTRGQRFVVSSMMSIYPEPWLAPYAFTLPGDGTGVEIPEDSFEDRVRLVEIDRAGGIPYRPEWRRYNQVTDMKLTPGVATLYPLCVWQEARTLYFAPEALGGTGTMRYVRTPDPLVLPQGRITVVDPSQAYIVVDAAGGALSSAADDLGSYINIVNPITGRVRASYQIASIISGKISLRATPARTTVQGRTISGSTDADTGLTAAGVTEDDYVCPSRGSCVPPMNGALTSYLVQYAAAEISRAVGDAQQQITSAIEQRYGQAAAAQDVGRHAPVRVKNTSRVWNRGLSWRMWPRTK